MSRYVYVVPPFNVKVWVEKDLKDLAVAGDRDSRLNLAGSIRLRLKHPESRFPIEKIAQMVQWDTIKIDGSDDNVIPLRHPNARFGTCPHCGCRAKGIGIGLPCPNCGEITNYGR